jgi:hypothetical protein
LKIHLFPSLPLKLGANLSEGLSELVCISGFAFGGSRKSLLLRFLVILGDCHHLDGLVD